MCVNFVDKMQIAISMMGVDPDKDNPRRESPTNKEMMSRGEIPMLTRRGRQTYFKRS